MRGRLAAPLLVLTLVVTGCLGVVDDDATEDPSDRFEVAWADKALPFGDGHDHKDPAHHRNLSTPNFELVGHDPLISSHYGKPAGAYFCGDAAPVEDGRRLAAVESRSEVGFAIADVTNASEPRWLGELVMTTTRIYDLAVAPDGQHVVLVTSDTKEDPIPSPLATPGTAKAPSSTGLMWQTPCMDEPVPVPLAEEARAQAEDPVPRPMSIVLVSIEDPENPEVVQQEPLAGSGHSVLAKRIDDRDWVVATTTRLPGPVGTPGLNENGISAYEFYEIIDDRLELLSVWKRPPSEDPTDGTGPRGHDADIGIHPKTNETVAYLAGGDRFTLLDMTDPRQPTELGRWTVSGPGTPAEEGTLHTAYALPELWNGTHHTIIGPEHAGHPEGYPSGIVWVMDTTDPTDPKEVAAWTLPYEVDWNGTYMFSNHYFSTHEQTLFVSMYHGGIWAVDLGPLVDGPPDTFLSLDSIGVYLPTLSPPEPVAQADRWAPTQEEVLAFDDGTLVTFDGYSGLYTLTFDADDPAPAPEPWPIEPVTTG